MAAQQAHEAQLASINQDKHKKKLQVTIGVVAFLAVASLVGGGVFFKKNSDQAKAREAALQAERAALEERAATAEKSVKESQEKEAELKSALTNAKDEAERARIQKELAEQQETTAAARRGASTVRASSGSGNSGGSSAPKPAKAACNCTPGDPLCSCL
jgi:colicin import membrane protein